MFKSTKKYQDEQTTSWTPQSNQINQEISKWTNNKLKSTVKASDTQMNQKISRWASNKLTSTEQSIRHANEPRNIKMSKQQAKKNQDEQATSWTPQSNQINQETQKWTNNKLNSRPKHQMFKSTKKYQKISKQQAEFHSQIKWTKKYQDEQTTSWTPQSKHQTLKWTKKYQDEQTTS
jgi:hypothetical protein